MRRSSLVWGSAVVIAACGGNGTTNFNPDDAGGSDSATTNNPDTGVVFSDSGPVDSSVAMDVVTQEVAVVYAQSPTVLYKVDPIAKTMTTIGPFNGCSDVIDIAIDANSNGYATTFGGVYHLDLTNANCTLIASGSYPNSLSFVPKGTLDPSVEALVGYNGSTYVRIDTTTGAVTNVGGLTGGFESSGDIVSVTNGGTFLTVTGNSCGDCLLQVNPKTGDMIQNY